MSIEKAKKVWEKGLGPLLRIHAVEQYFLLLLLGAKDITQLKELYKKHFTLGLQLPVNCALPEDWENFAGGDVHRTWMEVGKRNLFADLKQVWREIDKDRANVGEWVLDMMQPGEIDAFRSFYRQFLEAGRRKVPEHFMFADVYREGEIFSNKYKRRFVVSHLAGGVVNLGMRCWLRSDGKAIRVVLIAETSKLSNDLAAYLKTHLQKAPYIHISSIVVEGEAKREATTFVYDVPTKDWYKHSMTGTESHPAGGWLNIAQEGFLIALESVLVEQGVPISGLKASW